MSIEQSEPVPGTSGMRLGIFGRVFDAQTTLRAGREISGNPHIRDLLDAYRTVLDAPEFRRETENPVDRANFFALLMAGMFRSVELPATARSWNYASLRREDINPVDPFQMAERRTAGETDEDVDARVNPRQRGVRAAALKTWRAGTNVRIDPEILIDNVRQFLAWRTLLNDILRARKIVVPGTASPSAPTTGTGLSRNEYFELLWLISKGEQQQVNIATAAESGIAGLRGYIGNLEQDFVNLRRDLNHVNVLRDDISLDLAGPTELLTRFGIALGPYLRREYLELRRKMAAGGPNAALWEERPMLAHAFLSRTAFPNQNGNLHFLEALRYHYDPMSPRDPALMHGMSRESVQAILSLVVQSFLVADEFLKKSFEQQSKLKSQVVTDEFLEKSLEQQSKLKSQVDLDEYLKKSFEASGQ